MRKEIPHPILDTLQAAATTYADSPATTDAGRILRFIARIIPVSFVVQLFAHKMKDNAKI
ncbi:hypothetical protein NJT12_04925 [Flavobacterium sp. AC]|uniref:Uncharacterized protein n=1 Tax=Flavobacterium azizsancarii TaxID=2961580 RepID=A0ABT4W8S8_9FLAO|nr:hypothetical protein [Flavobacterium azizsancarii]MDA6068960.1 hypothetical protein [Flavobacterium azizsancarii]